MVESITDCGAVLSPCGRYRYNLWRRWAPGPRACFVMLNPSTADASSDDPTIRKCIGFARRWGCGGILVVNLCAWRATDPRDLARAQAAGVDVAGPGNAAHIVAATAAGRVVAATAAGRVVAAWGAHAAPANVARVLPLLAGLDVECLGRTKGGAPRHPLMLPYSTVLEPFSTSGGSNG